MFKMFQRLLGCKKDVAVEPKAQVKEIPKPTIEEFLVVYDKFKSTVYSYVDVTPSNEAVIDCLKKAGLVAVTEEHVLDGNRGLVVRRYAKWIGGWDCTNCTEYFVEDLRVKPSLVADEVVLKNEPQCRLGFDMHIRDANKARRCPHYLPKKLVEVVGDV
jgi:hypothetical protein